MLTMGPWRVVAVGRTHRTLPTWLRLMLQMLHRRCEAPTATAQPACWTQAHHPEAFTDGGDTALKPNHQLSRCPQDNLHVLYRTVPSGRATSSLLRTPSPEKVAIRR